MFRLLLIFTGMMLLSGCASLRDDGLFASSSEFLSRTGDALGKIGKPNAQLNDDTAIQALFEQPYIDPLTTYLHSHRGASADAHQVARVRQERNRRCGVIADRYADRSATAGALAKYRAGYAYSCPDEVAAFAARVNAAEPGAVATESDVAATAGPEQAPQTAALPSAATREPAAAEASASQQLNDCFLLKAIRNFSAALEACRQPAKDGNVRAQTHMAVMANAIGDYDAAYRWASEAAPSSAEAANLLGELYLHGKGVAQDEQEAEHWFVRAARLGHAGAQARIDASKPPMTAVTEDHVH